MKSLVITVPAVALLAVVVGQWRGGWWGALVAVVAGVAVAVAVRRRLRREVDDLSDQVTTWFGQERQPTIESEQLAALRELGTVLHGVARTTRRRIATLEADVPWRRDLVRALPMAAVLFGADGYLVAANADARELLGIPSDGERVTMLAALGSAQLADATRRADEEAGLVVVDTELAGRHVRAHVTVVGDQRLVLVRDRSREHRVEDVRRNFVVNASHELKTPASAIQALAEALSVTTRTDPDRVADLAARLEQESQRLVRLVHDLLDLRRLEDATAATREVVDVVASIHEVFGEQAARAAERDVTLSCEAAGPIEVLVDPDDLRLVLRNLVSNAIKYNREDGDVIVGVTHGDPVTIEVRDTGIGIPRADLGRIFERFHRVDVARSRATGGTGLGLAMVRHAVSRNAGSIEVDSLLGTGTVFRLMLPPGAPVRAAAERRAVESLRAAEPAARSARRGDDGPAARSARRADDDVSPR